MCLRKLSNNEYDINPMYCVSLLGSTMQCGMKYTDINLLTFQDEEVILLLEKHMSGGIFSVMGDGYVENVEKKETVYIDASNLYGWTRSQSSPYVW